MTRQQIDVMNVRDGLNMKETLHIYYTSDLHSHFENWPKIVYFLKEKIHQHQRKQEPYLILDNGDHLDRVQPISEASKGLGNVTLLNEAKYDVVTFGNNEGITLDRDELYHLYDDAKFSVVCANVVSQDGDNPAWLKRYVIKDVTPDFKVGIIGLTAPFNHFYHPMGWDALDPLKQLKLTLTELTPQVDSIIVLSHLGVDQDELIAKYFDEVDLIIGGHTHHLFKVGKQINNSILSAVGKFGHYVGQASLTYDTDKRAVIEKTAHALPIDTLEVDSATEMLLDTLGEQASRTMSDVVCTLPAPLEVDWFKDTPIIQSLTETLKSWTGADLAMLNAGIILESLPKGDVTLHDLHRICPHPINPAVVEITGRELQEVIREGLTERYIHYPVVGYGFRGKVMGVLVYDGVEIELKEADRHEPLIRSIYINQKLLDPNKTYTLATADMFTFGHLAPNIAHASKKTYFMPEFMRDLLKISLETA